MHFKLKNTSHFAELRWDLITKDDAISLLGYCYGRSDLLKEEINVHPTIACLIGEDLVSALFVIGAHYQDIKFSILDYYDIVRQILKEKRYSEDDENKLSYCDMGYQLINILSLVSTFNINIIEDNFIKEIKEFMNEWQPEDTMYLDPKFLLEVHISAYTQQEVPQSLLTLLNDSGNGELTIALIKKDNQEISEIIDSILNNLIERVNQKINDEKLLGRTLNFRLWGDFLIWGGIRNIATKIGCNLPISKVKMPFLLSDFYLWK